MKEPRFRGKCVETNEWRYGWGWWHIDYTEEYKQERGIGDRAMLGTEGSFVECYLESMGWYTGLKDKNGVEIYEGDFIEGLHHLGPAGWLTVYAPVEYDVIEGYKMKYWKMDTLEVIGNIYENPELLEV